jgi:hypothetical protein
VDPKGRAVSSKNLVLKGGFVDKKKQAAAKQIAIILKQIELELPVGSLLPIEIRLGAPKCGALRCKSNENHFTHSHQIHADHLMCRFKIVCRH